MQAATTIAAALPRQESDVIHAVHHPAAPEAAPDCHTHKHDTACSDLKIVLQTESFDQGRPSADPTGGSADLGRLEDGGVAQERRPSGSLDCGLIRSHCGFGARAYNIISR